MEDSNGAQLRRALALFIRSTLNSIENSGKWFDYIKIIDIPLLIFTGHPK
jgi:hypothetical protein